MQEYSDRLSVTTQLSEGLQGKSKVNGGEKRGDIGMDIEETLPKIKMKLT